MGLIMKLQAGSAAQRGVADGSIGTRAAALLEVILICAETALGGSSRPSGSASGGIQAASEMTFDDHMRRARASMKHGWSSKCSQDCGDAMTKTTKRKGDHIASLFLR
jgi:hypothetical protein